MAVTYKPLDETTEVNVDIKHYRHHLPLHASRSFHIQTLQLLD